MLKKIVSKVSWSKVYRDAISIFMDKDLSLYAASLSFYTIFTLIPLLLIMLTLLTSMSGFTQYYDVIKSFIFSNLLPVNSEAIMGYIDGFLQNSATLGAIGLFMVLVASLLFFQNFEYIANRIFHAKERTFWKSVSIYIVILTLAPLALGISFYITGNAASLISSTSLTSSLDILPFVPYLIIWATFFLIFQISANTKIELKASLISSFVIAIVFSFAKNIFIYYVFYNKSYTTMYGSFAILMFLFLWIYVSWIIFIYGLKLCYLINRVYQNQTSKDT